MAWTVKVSPIIMSAPMVRALLEGKKTQTRRVIRKQPPDGHFIEGCPWVDSGFALWRGTSFPKDHQGCTCERVGNPYGDTGDLLWVRESWCWPGEEFPAYRADIEAVKSLEAILAFKLKWSPSIHMPRWASRITLRIKLIEPQRLQDISKDDAIAEGIESIMDKYGETYYIHNYRELWDSLNAKRGFGWDNNPWVWAITFEVIKENVDRLPAEFRPGNADVVPHRGANSNG